MRDVNTNEKECANDSRAVQFRRRQSPNTVKLRAMQPGRKGEGDNVQRNWNDHLSPLPLSGALQPAFQYNTASLHSIDTAAPQAHPTIDSVHVHSPSSPSSAGLRLQTDILARFQPPSLSLASSNPIEPQLQQPIFASPLPHRSSSVRSSLSAAHFTGGSLSPASAVSSPGLGPILDITPLPSPITAWGSPRRSLDSQESRDLPPEIARIPTPMGSSQEFLNFTRTSSKKWRSKPTFIAPAKAMFGRETQIYDVKASTHARNRSISDYAPDPAQILRNCHVVVSGTGSSLAELPLVSPNQLMHREEYLAIQRGLTSPDPKPPTPPRSNRDTEGSDLGSGSRSPGARKGSLPLRYEARTVRGSQLKQWKAVRQLGKGTFSTVMLAVSSENVGGEDAPGQLAENNQASTQEKQEGPAQRGRLVAVKICEYGPAGGADEKKVETSLKRELEILKAIDHPSLVHLKAFNVLDRRAYIILNYCAGGDLFELANFKPELLIPGLIRRIFTELVGAVQYLHAQYIVHRDIKLESLFVLTFRLFPRYLHSLITLHRRFGKSPHRNHRHHLQLADLSLTPHYSHRSWSWPLDSQAPRISAP